MINTISIENFPTAQELRDYRNSEEFKINQIKANILKAVEEGYDEVFVEEYSENIKEYFESLGYTTHYVYPDLVISW